MSLITLLSRWGAVAFLAGLCGCSSTVETTKLDGTRTVAKVGFGNKIQLDGTTIEPSPQVVQAGQAIATIAVQRATDAMLSRATDTITTAAVQTTPR